MDFHQHKASSQCLAEADKNGGSDEEEERRGKQKHFPIIIELKQFFPCRIVGDSRIDLIRAEEDGNAFCLLRHSHAK